MWTLVLKFLGINWLYLLLLIAISWLYLDMEYKERDLVTAQKQIITDKTTIDNLTYNNEQLLKVNMEYEVDSEKQNASIEALKGKGVILQNQLNIATLKIKNLSVNNKRQVRTILRTIIKPSNPSKGVTCDDAVKWGVQESKGLVTW